MTEGRDLPITLQVQEGEEIVFGVGSDKVGLPHPDYCNIRLAVARILHASGAAEAVERYLEDVDGMMAAGHLHFGNCFISDETLMDHMFVRLPSDMNVVNTFHIK